MIQLSSRIINLGGLDFERSNLLIESINYEYISVFTTPLTNLTAIGPLLLMQSRSVKLLDLLKLPQGCSPILEYDRSFIG